MPNRPRAAVVMAASAGGIDALRTVLRDLGAAFPLPVLIVQHTSSRGGATLCEVLTGPGGLPVVEGAPRLPVSPGRAYLAPPGYHLLVERGPRLALNVDERVCYVRPSADVLFESASDVWRGALIGVILTGSNEDGAKGLAAVRSRGGLAIVQDPEDAAVREMPAAALRTAGADRVVKLAQIGAVLSEFGRPLERGTRGLV